MSWFLIFIAICYVLLIVSLTIGFHKLSEFLPEQTNQKTKFSIVIPFRNEAKNLPNLLQSISNLDYSKELFEVIFVDDFSEDNSVKIIEEFFKPNKSIIFKNNRVSNSPKKDAISTAIHQAKHDWIVTTDADCKLPKKWLQTLDTFIQKEQPNMVVSSVNYEVNNSFLHRFQLLDFLSLQGTTIGGFGLENPFLCNGANLAYQKNIFKQLNGFDGNNHIVSGDDVFLFEKFLKHDKNSVRFLKSKDAIVTTYPVNSWSDLVQQRVRWASKTSQVSLSSTKIVGILVFLMNLAIVSSLSLSVFQLYYFKLFLFLFASKLIVDILLFLPAVKFYNHKKGFQKAYFLSSLIYPFFSVFIVVYSVLFRFEWKGHSYKK